jgi:hypothetical protein
MSNSKELHGLQKLCKSIGHIKINNILWAWDYVNECALPAKELEADLPRWRASEKKRWGDIKKNLTKNVKADFEKETAIKL